MVEHDQGHGVTGRVGSIPSLKSSAGAGRRVRYVEVHSWVSTARGIMPAREGVVDGCIVLEFVNVRLFFLEGKKEGNCFIYRVSAQLLVFP